MFAKAGTECNIESVLVKVVELGQWLTKAAAMGTAEHLVERHVFTEMLAMGAKCLGEFFKSVGPGDLGETVMLENGCTVNRLPNEQKRRLVTVFGEFFIGRFVYGSRPGQKIELTPTDQRLQLPDSDLSYLLQDWNQMMSVEQPFGTVAKSLQTILGLKQSVDTLEHGNQQMAEVADAFRAAQPAPDPRAEGELLVATEDNKGVPMVRPVDIVPVGAHRKKGEKANKKQMACIGCVYTVDRHVRTPSELINVLFRQEQSRGHDAPKACQKRYWAELTREVAGEVVRAQDNVFQHMREEVDLRRRPDQTLVHLSDGQPSLEEDRDKYLPRDRKTVDILDLMHVNPRLWEAAHLFHPEGSDEATDFVRMRVLRVLQGKAKAVKALRNGIDAVYGEDNPVQQCRNHKVRNVCDHLPKDQHANARATLRAAWKLDAAEGKSQIEQLARWCEKKHPSAAASLREGLEEMFTINRMGLPPKLLRCLATTNVIDSSHWGVRQRTGRVTHWQDGAMALRWASAAFEATAKGFRRIMGHQQIWMLKAHLDEPKESQGVAGNKKAG